MNFTAKEVTKSCAGAFVDIDHIDMLKSTYRQTKWKLNSERLGTEDTLFAWFSIKYLKEFVEKSKSVGSDSIKIYFGAFPLSYPEFPLYAGRQTMVFAGAKNQVDENGNKVNLDIYYYDEASESSQVGLNNKSQVEMLTKSYRELKHKYNSEMIGKPDSLSATFTMKIFEEFISRKENQGANGIKIYFGAYPDDYENFPGFSGMQTLVLVGTQHLTGHSKDILFGDDPALGVACICPLPAAHCTNVS